MIYCPIFDDPYGEYDEICDGYRIFCDDCIEELEDDV